MFLYLLTVKYFKTYCKYSLDRLISIQKYLSERRRSVTKNVIDTSECLLTKIARSQRVTIITRKVFRLNNSMFNFEQALVVVVVRH